MAQDDFVLVLDADAASRYARPRTPAPGQRSLFREEDHPRAADGKWTDGSSHRNAPAKAGDTFDFPDSTTWAPFKGAVRDAGNGLSEIVDTDTGYVRSKMPAESIHRVIDDLSGRVAAKTLSGDSDVDAVLSGKAQFLGRGNDGLAFDVGNGKVVKASSELHFHWNNGIRSQKEGADRIRNQVTINEKLRAAGVPGLLPQRLVEHEGRAYAVMPKLDMSQPIDQSRAMQVYETIKAMRAAGYTIGDDIQAGVGTDGKAYIFDTGAVRPLATSGPAASHDKQDDESRIERFFQKAGVPRPAGLNPDADYEDTVQSFGRHKKNADKRGRWDPGPAAYLRDSLSRNFAALDEHMREFLGDSHQEMIDELTAAAQPKGESMQATATDKYAAARSLFHEEDHPRGQPENAGQFAPKGGGTAAKPAEKSAQRPLPKFGGEDWPKGNDEKTPVPQADIESAMRDHKSLDSLRRELIWPSSIAKLNRIVNSGKETPAEMSGLAIPSTEKDAKQLAKVVRRVSVDQHGKDLRHQCNVIAKALYVAFKPKSEIWSGNYPTNDEHGGFHVLARIGDYLYDVTADQFGGPKTQVIHVDDVDGNPVYGTFRRDVGIEKAAEISGTDGMYYSGRLYKDIKPGSTLLESDAADGSEDRPASTGTPKLTAAFQSAFDFAAEPTGPLWQPKLFQGEPSGQKTMFDAGIEKGFGKKKPAAAKQQQSLLGPSLVEKIEAEIAKQAEASKPMPGQKAMFSRIASARSQSRARYQQGSDDSNGPAHWITIGGHPGGNGKRHAGGTPVKVDGSGNIVAGPDSLEGKPIDAIDQNKKPEAPAQHFHASEFTGDFRKDFKAWAKQSAVPRLEAIGYENLDAQMISFKAGRSGSLENAMETLNGYANKKGPPKQTPQEPQAVADAAPSPEPPAAQALAPTPTPAPAPQAPQPPPEPEIPAAPEWFNSLRAALESGTAAKSFAPDDSTAVTAAGSSPGDSTDDIHFAEWTPDEGPENAPPPSVTKLPDAIDPLQHVQRLPDGRLVGATQMNVRSLSIDPNRFQYKFVGVGSDGVTKELKDSKKFNPMLGGQLLVWQDPGDGKTYVINGHHRYDLAMRSLEANPDDPWNGNMSVYFIDAATPAEARALGAVTNIAEGRGTAIDAAKFLRDTNAGLDDLQKHGVSVRGAIARDAVPLSKLSPTIWQSVAQEMTNPEQGIAIAKHLGDDHDSQDELFQIIKRREQKTEKEIPAAQVEEMAREMKMTPKIEEDGGLLGDYFKRSLLAERAVLKAAVNRAIAGEQNTFQAVSSKRRVGMLSSEGNVIDAEGNRERAKDAARQIEDFRQQSNWAGNPIAEAVSKAAERLANEPRKAKAIERELIEHVRGLLANPKTRRQSGDGADQLGEGGGGVPVDATAGAGESAGGERYARRGPVHRYAALTAALERATVSTTF